MMKLLHGMTVATLMFSFLTVGIHTAEARGRRGSIRIGGTNSHGKGGHYYGGY